MPYIDFFHERKADLVYLTADSPNELSELDSSKLYIIGGIVDRNRHKNICFNKAVSQVTVSQKFVHTHVLGMGACTLKPWSDVTSRAWAALALFLI